MSRPEIRYRTTFPGGLAPVSALRAIAELSLARGDGSLRLSSCQQLELKLPKSTDVSSIPSLERLHEENAPPTVPMSTAGIADCCTSLDWLSLGAFQEVLDRAPRIGNFVLGVSDSGQSYLPTYLGDATLVASEIPYYWHIAVRERDGAVRFLPWALPSESAESFIHSLDETAARDGVLDWATINELITNHYHQVAIAMEELSPEPTNSGEAIVGVQPMPSGDRSCVAFYPEWGVVSAQFLLDLCLLAGADHVGMATLTPYRSMLVPNIPTPHAKRWRQLAGRFQLPMYPLEIATQCIVGDDAASQQLAQNVIEALAEERCHASGLSMAFMSPAHRGESMIRIEREPRRWDRWTRLFPRYALYGTGQARSPLRPPRQLNSGLSFSQLVDELKRLVAKHNVGGVTLEKSNRMTPHENDRRVMACRRCGTHYDGQFGDPVGAIEAGVSFDDLPGTWQCPVCESPKSEYALENQQDRLVANR
jgi:rubredoxin